MKTRFLFKGVDLDHEIRDYILKRLGEVSDLFHELALFETEVTKDKKGFFRVEVNVREPHKLHRAEETSRSVTASIDLVIDKLRVHIVKERTRRRDLRERGARSIKKSQVVDTAARF